MLHLISLLAISHWRENQSIAQNYSLHIKNLQRNPTYPFCITIDSTNIYNK